MELTGSYRHELKYQISPADHHALRQRLRAVMKRDPHAGADGLYTMIRIVHFDVYLILYGISLLVFAAAMLFAVLYRRRQRKR